MKDRKIVFLVEYDKAGEFFFRFAAAIGGHCVFVTALPSVYFKAKLLGYQAFLTGWRKHGEKLSVSDAELEATKAVALGAMPIRKARDRACEVFNAVKSAVFTDEENKDVYVLTWNGASVSGVAARAIKQHYPETKLLFLEIANLPGKIFVDPKGVNAQSSLYRDPLLLDLYDLPSDKEFSEWTENYVAEKSKPSYVAPQAKKQALGAFALIDFFYSAVFGNNYFGSPVLKIKNYLGYKNENKVQVDYVKHSEVGLFAFLPLQVSNDSQILINSDVDNVDAIRLISSRESCLLVKPHPAERDTSYLAQAVLGMSNVSVTDENTFDLIRASSKVYTINSTVGLEALILGKNVEFLGRSYFSHFNNDRLKRYIFSFLINIDFFSESKISRLDAENVLSRAA